MVWYFGVGPITKLMITLAIGASSEDLMIYVEQYYTALLIGYLVSFFLATEQPYKLLFGRFWFIDHASILRYYVLYYGVMSSFYVILCAFF